MESETTYRIIRFFHDIGVRETVARGLTLAEAREHCSDPETSSRTCTELENVRRTKEHGAWFDGYTEE